jgi:hypothetical protein
MPEASTLQRNEYLPPDQSNHRNQKRPKSISDDDGGPARKRARITSTAPVPMGKFFYQALWPSLTSYFISDIDTESTLTPSEYVQESDGDEEESSDEEESAMSE